MNKNLPISITKKYLFTLFMILMSVTYSYSAASGARQNTTQVKIIKCYPNPATSVINFELEAGTEKNTSYLQIYSFSGRKMTDVTVTSSKITVTLDNDYYRGIYIYQLRDKSGEIIQTGKFQVVK